MADASWIPSSITVSIFLTAFVQVQAVTTTSSLVVTSSSYTAAFSAENVYFFPHLCEPCLELLFVNPCHCYLLFNFLSSFVKVHQSLLRITGFSLWRLFMGGAVPPPCPPHAWGGQPSSWGGKPSSWGGRPIFCRKHAKIAKIFALRAKFFLRWGELTLRINFFLLPELN